MEESALIEEFKASRIEKSIATSKSGDDEPTFSTLAVDSNGEKVESCTKIGSMMDNEENKTILFYGALPGLFKELESKGYKILCISFTSEVWVWKMDANKPIPPPDQRQHLDREERLMITFEGADWATLITYKINRCDGMNLKYDLTIDGDNENEGIKGRMGELLRRYNQEKHEHKNTNS